MKVTYFQVTRIELEPGTDNDGLYELLGDQKCEAIITNPELNVLECRSQVYYGEEDGE